MGYEDAAKLMNVSVPSVRRACDPSNNFVRLPKSKVII
jgi:hypothetical protein